MTNEIVRDAAWLEKQIALGVQFYLENESENIAKQVAEYIMHQIDFECCREYSDYDSDEEGRFLIEKFVKDSYEIDRRFVSE